MTVAQPDRPQRRVHLDDVDHFLGYGYSLDWIAARLGVQVDSIRQAQRRAARRGCHPTRPRLEVGDNSDAA